MHLTILAEPDCPNAPVLRDRLAAVLNGQAGISVSDEVIRDESEAVLWGMHGSPALLIDGVGIRSPSRGSRRACPVGCIAPTTAGHRARGAQAGSGRQSNRPWPRRPGGGIQAWLQSLGRGSRGRVGAADVAFELSIRPCCDRSCTRGLRPASAAWPSTPPRSACQRCWPNWQTAISCASIMPVRSLRRTRSGRCRPGTECRYQGTRPCSPCARSTPWACPRWSASLS